jgi:hypothetical protein
MSLWIATLAIKADVPITATLGVSLAHGSFVISTCSGRACLMRAKFEISFGAAEIFLPGFVTVGSRGRTLKDVYCPLWMPLIVVLCFVEQPLKSVKVGHCVACGYDLTGNVSGRCPECGTTIARPA